MNGAAQTASTEAQKPVNFRVLALSVAIGLAVIFAFFGEIPFIPQASRPIWLRLFDSGHLIIFSALSYALTRRVEPSQGKATFVRLSILGVVALSIEAIQPWFDRNSSEIDLANGFVGILIGWGAALAFQTTRMRPRVAILTFATIAFSISLLPAIRELLAYYHHQKAFPVLGSFEDDSDLHFWTSGGCKSKTCPVIERVRSPVFRGNASLHVKGTGGNVGIQFNAGDRSWLGYNRLEIPIFAAKDAVNLYIRIDDDGDCTEFTSRYNAHFILSQGWNNLAIPLEEIRRGPSDRSLNLGKVRRLILFISTSDTQEFFLDEVQLQNRSEVVRDYSVSGEPGDDSRR